MGPDRRVAPTQHASDPGGRTEAGNNVESCCKSVLMVTTNSALTMKRANSDFSSSTGTGEWLTTLEVATLLRVHPKHVYRLLHQGMPARRVGGQWRFSRADIQQWADQRGGPMAATPPQVPTAATSTTIVAIEPNEVADAVASVFREGPPPPLPWYTPPRSVR